jgi:hypothetical protein
MASIIQAAKWMQEGKGVIRPRYKPDLVFRFDEDRCVVLCVRAEAVMYIDDLLAEDWEIAE